MNNLFCFTAFLVQIDKSTSWHSGNNETGCVCTVNKVLSFLVLPISQFSGASSVLALGE